jgi:putative membrane protein
MVPELEDNVKRIASLGLLVGTPAAADTNGYDDMMNWGFGMGMMFGPVLWLIVLGLVVAGIIWFVRSTYQSAPQHGRSNARAELDLRFAKGEIDADDYAARKKLLES